MLLLSCFLRMGSLGIDSGILTCLQKSTGLGILIFLFYCRWNRLENLIVQGRQDRDFSAKDALQPVLKLLLGQDGEELRSLVIKEAVRVTEAFVLGTVIDTYSLMPDFMRTLIFNVNGNSFGPLVMSNAEQQSLIELRNQVSRIWVLLQSSENFDPASLQPILQVSTTIIHLYKKYHYFLFLNFFGSSYILFLFFF